MSIISVLNPKGGSGKTTISTNLARSLHEMGPVSYTHLTLPTSDLV